MQKGAEVNIKDNGRNLPVHYAIESTHLEIVKLLINENNINSMNNYGRTPLHLAADHGILEIVQYLLESGAKISVEDNNHKTPLDLAKRKKHEKIVELIEPALKYQK